MMRPRIGFATLRLLEAAGCEVVVPNTQTCCGQPAFNAGFREEARSVCAKFINDFKDSEYIVAPSASCVGFVRNYYPELFDDSSNRNQVRQLQQRTFEFSEFLTDKLGVTDVGASFSAKATYHDSCAALRECKIKSGPRELLRQVKGLELVEMNEVETCCGFGGTFAVKFEPISVGMGDQKVIHAAATGAQCIISTDLSCLMHIQGVIQQKGLSMQTFHLADILASGW